MGNSGVKKYHVTYFYLATGMEGHADKEDFGVVSAISRKEAIDKIISKQWPYASDWEKGWYRSCLSAKEVKENEELSNSLRSLQQVVNRLSKDSQRYNYLRSRFDECAASLSFNPSVAENEKGWVDVPQDVNAGIVLDRVLDRAIEDNFKQEVIDYAR